MPIFDMPMIANGMNLYPDAILRAAGAAAFNA